jgi:hypothetical protein
MSTKNGQYEININEPQKNLTNVSDLNSTSIATEEQSIIKNENKKKGLRSARIYDLDKFKNDKTLKDNLSAGCKYLAKKTRSLKKASFYKNFLLSKFPIIAMFLSYKFKSYLLPDIISGVTGTLIFRTNFFKNLINLNFFFQLV